MIIQANEKKYVENILKDGFYILDFKPSPLLLLMAQYYYQFEGYRKSKITSLLQTFLADHYPEYKANASKLDKLCERIAQKTGGYKLLESDGVAITQKELNTISKLNDKKLERLAFTILVLAKYCNLKSDSNNNWLNFPLSEVYKLARIGTNKKVNNLMIHKLYTLGLIRTAKRVNNTNICVTFADNNGKPKAVINDFRELGYQYSALQGEKYFNCSSCGIIVKLHGGNIKTKMCKSCYEGRYFSKRRCMDCGRIYTYDVRASQSCRCNDCQKAKNREKKADWKRNKKGQVETRPLPDR